MKKFIYLCAIMLLAFQTRTSAQGIHLSADSVTKLLCKKWEADYVLAQGKRINVPLSTSKIYLEFHKDGTFSAISGKPKVTEKGEWEYDVQNGTISMSVKGKDRRNIISLTKYHLAILPVEQVAVNDTSGTKLYFKVKPTTR